MINYLNDKSNVFGMEILATLYFGFFIIYYIIFFIILTYTAIIEEWCCTNHIPRWYEKIKELINRCHI